MKVKAILDKQFRPMALVCREMREATEKDGQDIVIGIERNNGYVSAYKRGYTATARATTSSTLILSKEWSSPCCGCAAAIR